MPPIPPNPDRSAVTTAIAELIGCSYRLPASPPPTHPTPEDTMSNATIAAGLPIASDKLAKPPLNIPDDLGRPYKTELVIARSPERTVKINWWHAPDDAGSRARPHSHPWSFTSTVLHGAITHTRFRHIPAIHDAGTGDYGSGPEYSGGTLVQPASVEQITETIRAGESYVVLASEYHLVTAVEPGTVTQMECGPLENGGSWGYLDLKTGEHIPATPDPDFRERLVAVNPWMR